MSNDLENAIMGFITDTMAGVMGTDGARALAESVFAESGKPRGLRATLEAAGGPMNALTVLSAQNDPFRVDTPAGHRDGQWLADKMAELRLTGPRHLRGLHYALIDQTKPNGKPYTNTDEDWQWLAIPAKAARWLGYVPFERIVDQRNDQPEVELWKPPNPRPVIKTDFDVLLPDAEDLRPLAGLAGFTPAQPYKLVLVGEKSSLRPVLRTIKDRYQADLYLPTGEISDTQSYLMARSAAADGRPLAVFYFADCDPSGWQMGISLSRKLQAQQAMQFPDMQFQLHRVALTPAQVREYGLPSTPLKDTEKRADKWQTEMGVQQTEIDALAALQPELLESIADAAVSQFFDRTLARRVRQAKEQWQAEAQQVLDDAGGGNLEQLRTEAAELLEEKRAEIAEILDTVQVDPDALGLELPPIPDLPEAEINPVLTPLVDSRWSFRQQCAELIASKQYRRTEEM